MLVDHCTIFYKLVVNYLTIVIKKKHTHADKHEHTRVRTLSTFASILCIFVCPLLASLWRSSCPSLHHLCHSKAFASFMECSPVVRELKFHSHFCQFSHKIWCYSAAPDSCHSFFCRQRDVHACYSFYDSIKDWGDQASASYAMSPHTAMSEELFYTHWLKLPPLI